MASVRLVNVRKTYRRDTQEVPVLDGVTFDIGAGDYVALMGPSGSGKTTLLNLIGGIDSPTSGDVIVADTNLSKLGGPALAKWRSRNIGYIFQLYNLIPVLTAIQNVELPLLLVKMSGKER
jgi:putative ABC transport system ATP-binding protein